MKDFKLVSRYGVAALATAMLAGCGLAETGAVAGAQGASAAEQAKQAKETQEKLEADIAAAQAANEERISAAEAATQ